MIWVFSSFANQSASSAETSSGVKTNTNPYNSKVLVIYKSGTDQYLDIYQNFKQSYLLNTQVMALNDNQILTVSLAGFDTVYPDTSLLTSPNLNQIRDMLITYVSNGGCLFLENEWAGVFPSEFTGVESFSQNNDRKRNFSYPQASYNLKQLQLVIKGTLDNFTDYKREDLKSLQFNQFKTKEASSLVNINNNSLIAVNKYKNGWVCICSSLLPNNERITGFDLRAKQGNQGFFDFSLATANYYIRNEFLAFSMKEKYGFVLKKIFGPYGRPAMAWQNHYEALGSIKDKEMIKWIDLLKNYNEIPSFTLIRSSYEWGQWQTDLTLHINKGSANKPIFEGEGAESYYSSGKRIDGSSDHITFGDYPVYKSLADPITLPYRAYPTVADYDGDMGKDLIVGAPDGKLYLLKNTGTPQNPCFTDKIELTLNDSKSAIVSRYAAPFNYDFNKDGLFDLIVGDGDGFISVFINKGKPNKPSFDQPFKLKDSSGHPIKVNSCSAPFMGDIDGDGTDDLIIGDTYGSVSLYKGSAKGFTYQSLAINLGQNSDRYSAPAIIDWNKDGKNDILIGVNSGVIKIFINDGKAFNFTGTIEGETYNPNGTHSLIGGHNSVPLITDWNADGLNDLIVGQLEFGIPYDIDGSFFKYKSELTEILNYAQKYSIPVNPHFSTHVYKNSQQEETELELHKKAFQAYNLPWISLGTNQHTGRINAFDPQQTFKNELASGIWWNFFFTPPNNPGTPRDSKEFLWTTPFLLSNRENTSYPLMFSPSPNLFFYPNVYKSLSSLDMPITYYEHIDYRFSKPAAFNELKKEAEFLNKTRDNENYNFMTEEQMAKSFINTFFSKADVLLEDKQLIIKGNVNDVPALAGEYKGTLGLKFEKGEKLKNTKVVTTSPIHFEKGDSLYFAATNEVKIMFDGEIKSDFYLERVNVPITLDYTSNVTRIEFLSAGMQQVKLFSLDELQIKGTDIEVLREGKHYIITHYGPPMVIEISN